MPEFEVDVLIKLIDEVSGAANNIKASLNSINSGVEETASNTTMLQQAMSTAAGVMIRDLVQGAFGAVTSACREASQAFQDFELTLTKTVASSGVVGDEAVQLSGYLSQVAQDQTDLGFSAREASAGLESFVKAGLSGEDAATALSAGLMLARVESLNTGEAADMLVATLTQFHLEASQATDAMDTISKAASAGIDNAANYASGLSNCGAAAAAMGFSLDDTLAAMIMVDKNQKDAVSSGTYLNMTFRQLAANSDKLDISLYNSDGSMRSLSNIVDQLRTKIGSFGGNMEAINEYFGQFDSRAQKAVLAMVNYSGSIDDVKTVMGQQIGIQEKTNDIMGTAAGQLAKLEAREENASLALGNMTAGVTLLWKEFAVALGPVGALVDALGPTVLQAAFTGASFAATQMVAQMIVQYGVMDTLSMVTYTLTTAMHGLAIGVAAAAGAFGVVYAVLMNLPEETRQTASIIAILTGVLVAATVAAAAFYGVLSLGVAVPAILAGIGTAVAGVTVALSGASATADNFSGSVDNLSASLDGLGGSLEQVRSQVQQLAAAEEQAYQTGIGNLQKHYTDKYGTTITEETRIEDVINQHYTKLVEAAKSAYSTDIDNSKAYFNELWGVTVNGVGTLESFVASHYDDALRELQSSYGDQIDATNSFYDDLQASADAGLNALRGNRDSDLDSAELDMLLQKEAVRSAHDEGLISNETYNNQLAHIEAAYNAKRGEINDSYRLQELELEIENKKESESIARDRADALATIAAQQAESEVTLMEQKNRDLEAARGMQTQAEQRHNTTLKGIEDQRVADLAEMYSEMERLTEEHNERMHELDAKEAEYWRRSGDGSHESVSEAEANSGGGGGGGSSAKASPATVAGWIAQSIRDGGVNGPEEIGSLTAYKMQQGGLDYGQVSVVMREVISQMQWPAASISSLLGLVPHFAEGFHGVVDEPMLFLAGEAGREQVDVSPLAAAPLAVSSGGGGNVTVSIYAPVNIASVGGEDDRRWIEEELRMQREMINDDVRRYLKK